MDDRAKEAIEQLIKTVDQVAGPGVYVITNDSMPRAEREGLLCQGFLQEGYTPEESHEKARQFLELAELASPRSFNA